MGDYAISLNIVDYALEDFIKERFTDHGLHVLSYEHPEKNNHNVLVVYASDQLIKIEAESWGILKRDKKGLIREYIASEHDLYEPPYTCNAPEKSLLTPSELSYCMHEIIKRVKMKRVPDFFPRSKSAWVLPSDSLILALERLNIAHCWPLHCPSEERMVSWKVGPFKASFCDFIEHYFGSSVALYFAWLKNYTLWLLFPATAGLVVFIYHHVHPDINVDNSVISPVYTFLTVIWGVLFVKFWDRNCASFISHWGINTVNWRREVRPGYHGQKRISPVTGMPERYFPTQQRILRYVFSGCITFLMLILAFFVMVISLNIQGYIHKFSYSKNYLLYPTISWLCDEGQYFDPSGKGPVPYLLLYIPVILHVIIIQMLNKFYQVVAENLTSWENHRSPIQHENALYVKRFFFEAFDCYIALFYLAFVENDIVLLRRELVSLYTVDSIRRLSTETIIPFVTRKATRKIITKIPKGNTGHNSRVNKDYDKNEYEQFDDYLEMIIQLGYVTLFAGAFPLAAPLSVICNVLELYSDTFKLTAITRRPVVHRVLNIGVWSILIKFIILLSVFTNLYIFCFTSEQLMTYVPSLFEIIPLSKEEALKSGSDHIHVIATGAGMVVTKIMMCLEHFILLLAAMLWILIPSTTQSVDDEMARREYAKFLTTHNRNALGQVSSTSMGTKNSTSFQQLL